MTKPAASLSVKEGDTGNCLMFGHAGRDLVERERSAIMN
jgi:hypothetical protein